MPMFSPHATRLDPTHTELVTRLVEYHRSGAYGRDQERVGLQALAWVKSLARRGAKRALVLDVDETSLGNDWPSLVKPGLAYDAARWQTCILAAKDPAVPTTLEIFRAARARGIDVFFVTGRHPDQGPATVKNLRHAGYEGWSDLLLEPRLPSDPTQAIFPTSAAYKTAARWSLVARGYEIVASVGDQTSDLVGGYADKTFQLPNPFYTIE